MAMAPSVIRLNVWPTSDITKIVITSVSGIDDALFRYNNSRQYVRGVTLLAGVMERQPRAYYGYYHWDVYYLTTRGDVRLPVGYDRDRPLPVAKWLATHPRQ